jgi:Zn-dependent protease
MMDTFASLFPHWHWSYLLLIPGLLVGFTVHELGHSLLAYFLGDTSQVKQHRITPNPFKHISWLGTILFILLGIGWPKSIRFDPENFKDRYLDSFLVAMAGPAANMAASVIVFVSTAILVGILSLANKLDGQQISAIFFFSRSHQLASLEFSQALQETFVWVVAFTNRIWVANFILGSISLIPLPPFDGFTAILSLLGLVKEERISQLTQDTPPPQAESKIIEPQSTSDKQKGIASIHFRIGAEYHQQQKFNDAIARYRRAIQADPGFGPAYVNMGLAYKAKNQIDEAIRALRGATRYASDEKSRIQAWAELQNLSAFSEMPQDQDEQTTAFNSGTIPWTDIKPVPDWLTFWAGVITLLLMFGCLLGILLTSFLGG